MGEGERSPEASERGYEAERLSYKGGNTQRHESVRPKGQSRMNCALLNTVSFSGFPGVLNAAHLDNRTTETRKTYSMRVFEPDLKEEGEGTQMDRGKH